MVEYSVNDIEYSDTGGDRTRFYKSADWITEAKMSYTITGTKTFVTDFFVNPFKKGQGIGSTVYRLFENFLRSEGVEQVELVAGNESFSDEQNVGAQRFWAKMGFKPSDDDEGTLGTRRYNKDI